MGYNFPNAPTVGSTYTPAGGPTWKWDGQTWGQIPVTGPQGPQGIQGDAYETYGVSIYRAAGIALGGYYTERSANAASTQAKLYAEIIAGNAGATVDFYLSVNNAMVYGPLTVTLGTPVNLSGLTIAVAAGNSVSFVVTAMAGNVTEFFAKTYGKIGP